MDQRARAGSHPCVAREGTRLFDDDPNSDRDDPVSGIEFSNGPSYWGITGRAEGADSRVSPTVHPGGLVDPVSIARAGRCGGSVVADGRPSDAGAGYWIVIDPPG